MRKLFVAWLLLCAGVALAALQGVAFAQEPQVSADDARALQAVIRAQLAAFAEDQAGKAFAYATPSIQRAFVTPENFLAMVRNSYPVVYRPAAVAFLAPFPASAADGAQVLQPVRMTDADGLLWIAVYMMQRQPDGAWLTNGCRLARSQGQVT